MVRRVMRAALPLLVVFLVACGTAEPVARPQPEASVVAPSPVPPTVVRPTDPPPSAPPGAETPRPTLADPVIAWTEDRIPLQRTLALRDAPITDEVRNRARAGVARYLLLLNYWRDDPRQHFPASGAFGAAVKEGLTASATPGVKRRFATESVSVVVDRYLVKPWGTPALAEVRATIIDKVMEGIRPDQTETGRLLLRGDRLDVVDGWDAAKGTWSNGSDVMTEDELRKVIGTNLPWYLRLETWLPGSPIETGFGPGTSPFWAARHEHLNSFDRSKVVSRTFADLRGKVERYETFRELKDGLATVLLTGTVVTVDASGTERRDALSRRLVVLNGNSGPEVVDEEISPGVWRSAGQLYAGLKERDRNFA